MLKSKKMKSVVAIGLALTVTFMSLQWNVLAYTPSGDPLSEDSKAVDIYINASPDSGYKTSDIQTLLENKLNNANKATSGTTFQVLNTSNTKLASNQTSIDTTDLSDWYVYDHYDSGVGTTYANGGATGSTYTPPTSWTTKFGQPSVKRPYFAYAEPYYYYNNSILTIENFLASNNTSYVARLDRHIYSYTDSSGKPAMTFAGYGIPGYCDFLYYPTASTETKNVKFRVDSNYVNTHTLNGAGFLVNTGIDPTTKYMSGYVLYYQFASATQVNSISLYKINANTSASTIHENGLLSSVTRVASVTPPTWTSLMDIDLTITPTSLVVNEKSSSSSVYAQVMSVSNLTSTYQGFGPVVQYNGHSCEKCSMFKFSNLEMAVAEPTGSVLDSLAKSNFLTNSDKYFINIQGKAGTSTLNTADWEGITRIRKDQINYVTNVANPFLSDGSINTTDLTAPLADNGKTIMDATSAEELATKIADYILGNYSYKQPSIALQTLNPIANYTLVADSDGTGADTQVVKVNGNLITAGLNIFTKDFSEAPAGKTLNTYRYLVTTPNGTSTVITRTAPADKTNPLMTLTSSSVPGEYTVELTVTDSLGAVSNVATTTFTLTVDNTAPAIVLTTPSVTTSAYTGNSIAYTATDAGEGVKSYSYTYNGNVTFDGTNYSNQTFTTTETVLDTAVASKTFANESIPYGTYMLTITAYDGAGNKATKSFNVNNIIDLSTVTPTVTLGYATTIYDGTAKTPSINVQANGKTLTVETDYKVTYSNNINAGTATVKIDGCGIYKGSATRTFVVTRAIITVTPASGQNKYYGQSDPTFAYSYSGNIVGETAGFNGILTRIAGENAGDYGIRQGSLAFADNETFKLTNYTCSFSGTPVNFTIVQRAPALDTSYKIEGAYNASTGWYTSAVIVSPMGIYDQIYNAYKWIGAITINNQVQNISVQLKDSTSGEITSVLAGQTIKSDSITPTINVTNIPTTWVKSAVLSVSAQAGVSGVKSVVVNGKDITSTYYGGYPVTENGTYTFTVTSNAGLSSSKTVEISQIDNSAPEAPIINSSDIYTEFNWYNIDQTIAATYKGGTGSPEKLQYSLDGGKTWTDGTTVTVTKEASNIVSFRVLDSVGNESVTSNVVVKIDRTNPNLSLSDVSGWKKTAVTVGVTASDGLAGIQTVTYSTDEAIPQTGIVTLVNGKGNILLTKEGQYKLTVYAKDNAGNTVTKTADIQLDKTAPVLSVIGVPQIWEKDVELTVNVTPGISQIKNVTVNGTDITATYKNGYPVLQNGTYLFEVIGNSGLSASQTVVVNTLDKDIPNTPSIQNKYRFATDKWYNTDQTVSAEYVAKAGSPEKLQYSLDAGINWLDGTDVTVIKEGANTVLFRVIDAVGNISSGTDSVVVQIDKTNPEVANINVEGTVFNSFKTGIPFDMFFSNRITATVSGLDKLSGVKTLEYQKVSSESAYNPNGNWVMGNPFIVSPCDSFIVYAKITDNAGNITIVNTKGIVVDNTKPDLNVADVNGSKNADVTVEVSASDSLAGILTVTYTTDEAIPQTGVVTLVNGKGNVVLTKEGHYTLAVTAKDNCGNIITKSLGVIIDKTPPNKPEIQTVIDNNTKNIIGIAEPGSTVSVFNSSGNVIGTAIANSNGSYSISMAKQASATTINIIAADAAGNISDKVAIKVQKLSSHVADMIDALPNPDIAIDAEIVKVQVDIIETKQAYDTLDEDGRSLITDAQKDKLDALIGKLNALLVLITKDSSTGITVDGVGTAVVVDELSYKDVSKVKISLKVDLIEKTEATKSANIAIATTTLQNDNKQLFAAFDISLLKSVYGVTGDVTSSKVSNSNIVDYITVRIPIPTEYIGRTDLQVVYIDDNGEIHPYDTTIVTMDGVQCLEFKTNHFSEYAIIGNVETASVQIVSAQTVDATPIMIWVITLTMSGISVLGLSRKRRKLYVTKK